VIRAVDDVSFDVGFGEVLGVIGESGSGKTTLARAIVRLTPAISGQIIIDGVDWNAPGVRITRQMRRNVQMIFQDPFLSLDPRMTVAESIREAVVIHFPGLGIREQKQKVMESLEMVGLPASIMEKYPHELSGGQCQRVAIARALVVEPRLLICDEPTSALDVSVQAQILNLLSELKRSRGLTYLFISHDLPAVAYLANRLAVMHAGRLVEVGPTRRILDSPAHPYTQVLIQTLRSGVAPCGVLEEVSMPSKEKTLLACPYYLQCSRRVVGLCNSERPIAREIGPHHIVECHLAGG
jgi:oligopeptide/dipeptide ABC transporter ATP-binding protein